MIRRLLFTHGRMNHIRISQLILYFFFKNFFFTIIQFYFGFYCNFSGQPVLDEWYITLYNIYFTSFPLVARALFDQDLKSDDGIIIEKMFPFLYEENREYPEFSKLKLFFSLLRGFLYGIFIYFFCLRIILPDTINSSGIIADHFVFSSIVFACIYHGVSFRILILKRNITFISCIVFFIFSYGLYIMYICFMNNSVGFKSTGAIAWTFNSGRAYLCIVFLSYTVGLVDFFTHSYNFNFNKTLANRLSFARNKLGKLEDEKKIPYEFHEFLEIYHILDEKFLSLNEINLNMNNKENQKKITSNPETETEIINLDYLIKAQTKEDERHVLKNNNENYESQKNLIKIVKI